jgi:CRISPR/Cas system endoribonuclease Cas6 (RAMP superfamily)
MVHIISQYTAVIFSTYSLYTFQAHSVTTPTTFFNYKIYVFYPVYLLVSYSDYFPNTLSGWPSLQVVKTVCMRAINDLTLFKLNSGFKDLTKS